MYRNNAVRTRNKKNGRYITHVYVHDDEKVNVARERERERESGRESTEK